MFGSSMLDIAVGVVFIFLLLSVFATAINEVLFSFFNMRGKYLYKGIVTLLNDESGATTGLVQKIYNHGQVYGLYQGPFDPKKRRSLPSYIPARNFALAFLDSVAQPSSQAPAAHLPDPAAPAPGATASGDAPTLVPEQAPPAIQPDAARIQTDAAAAKAAVHQVSAISAEFRDAAARLASNPATAKVGIPLVSMIAMAGNDAAKLQKSIEDWFNSGMDRVSGRYKYRTQTVLLWIGLAIAVSMNADTIHILRQLSNDSTLRQSIVAAASSAAKPPAADAPASPGDSTPALPIDKQITAANDAVKNIRDLGLPIGWPAAPPTAPGETPLTFQQRAANTIAWVFHQPSMILGWILTAVAISLGAPFWFDALNKIMVIRSTIKPHEKSQEEGSKDKA